MARQKWTFGVGHKWGRRVQASRASSPGLITCRPFTDSSPAAPRSNLVPSYLQLSEGGGMSPSPGHCYPTWTRGPKMDHRCKPALSGGGPERHERRPSLGPCRQSSVFAQSNKRWSQGDSCSHEQWSVTDRGWPTLAWEPNPAPCLFYNKVLLAHSHTHSFSYCLLARRVESSACNGDHMYSPQSLKYVLLGPLQKRSADS